MSCLGKELRLRLYYKLLLELSLYFRTERFMKTIKGTELNVKILVCHWTINRRSTSVKQQSYSLANFSDRVKM